jgi:predicted nucleic acid-binding Zn ribbon protein
VPVYDYECKSGHVVRVEHSIHEEARTVCTKAGVNALNGDLVICCSPCKRLIPDRSSFVLIGSGWEQDGYSDSK